MVGDKEGGAQKGHGRKDIGVEIAHFLMGNPIIIAATRPRAANTVQFSASARQKPAVTENLAPKAYASRIMTTDEIRPRKTPDKTLPMTIDAAPIGATRYSSRVLWYRRLMFIGVPTALKLMVIEFKAITPGTMKSR